MVPLGKRTTHTRILIPILKIPRSAPPTGVLAPLSSSAVTHGIVSIINANRVTDTASRIGIIARVPKIGYPQASAALKGGIAWPALKISMGGDVSPILERSRCLNLNITTRYRRTITQGEHITTSSSQAPFHFFTSHRYHRTSLFFKHQISSGLPQPRHHSPRILTILFLVLLTFHIPISHIPNP